MINANELRIGNWAHLYNKEDGTPYYARVTGITETGKIWFVPSPKYEECAWGPKKIEPIPLTEEWLVKFGFEWSLRRCTWTSNKLVLEQWDRTIYRVSGHEDIEVKIEYVHSLQNLYFALTGEELTIKE